MWCKVCNMETNETICPVCGMRTVEDIPMEIYWCEQCKTPVIVEVNNPHKDICPLCKKETEYLSKDLRPVFPQERLLLEILLKKAPNEYVKKSVWASTNRYFIDGETIVVPIKQFADANIESIVKQLEENEPKNTDKYFEHHIKTFINANKYRFDYIVDEASEFVREVSEKIEEERIVISFSGGKDSTATADVVTKALGNPSLVHIFGNTTLEFPTTEEYAIRFRKKHPHAIFQVAQNYEQNFMDVCEDIGPPARMMRWCCSMFKTGPITRVINGFYRNQQILTFYGIRKAESVSRSKYNRIEDAAESVKIQQQTVASPIFFWRDIDVWLYILSTGIDFNDAYRWGYDRVGCWCCPNNNERAQFLTSIYMPDKSKMWRDFLIKFAKHIGKPDPEVYVDGGWWKARQGGNGLEAASDVKIKFTNCTAEDHAKVYKLVRPFDDELVGMFVPFGRIAPELGSKLLNEVIVLHPSMDIPILSLQPFEQEGYDYAVKVKTLNVGGHEDLQRMVGYQIRKFNACRKCLKCESLCKAGAISIMGDRYYIDPNKCVHCKKCIAAKYIEGGCVMDRFLRTKEDNLGV